MPLSEEKLVTDAFLGLRVLSLVEFFPVRVVPAALDDVQKNVIVLLPHSPFAEGVPLVLV